MIRLALALAAGYAGFKVAYHSQDGRHYGGVTYAALLSH